MRIEVEEGTGIFRDLTQEDLVRLGLDRKGKWQYTVADIEALPEGVWAELIDGEIFVSMTTPSTRHQELIGNLFFQIKQYVMEKGGKCQVFPAPFGVCPKDDEYNFVVPDISLICRDEILDEKGCYGAPDLVMEVVSPSNRKMDYVRKLALYREAGVREYWIVDPKYDQVTVYDLEHGKEPVLYPFTERILVQIYGDLYLSVTDADITLRESGAKVQQEGIKKGRAEGLAEGIEKGRAEGLSEGIEKGHAEGLSEGIEKGRIEGETRLAKLAVILQQEGRTDDLTKALTDAAYRDSLYQEYDL